MKALLLSAGIGTRLKPLTNSTPKVMIKLNDKPCLWYAINNLKKQGITEFAINTHAFPEQIKNYFGNGEKFGVKITYSFEQSPLGTAGALNNFKDFFTDDFLVVYGDVIANFEIKKLLEVHKNNNAEATIMLDSSRSPIGKGLAKIDGEKVLEFEEKPKIMPKTALINSGFYLLQREILNKIHRGFSDFGKDILPQIAKERKLYFTRHEGYIFDMGTIQDLKKAEEFLMKHNI